MNTLFWIMLTAVLVYAAGYLIHEFRQRLSEYRAEQAMESRLADAGRDNLARHIIAATPRRPR